MRIGLVGDHQGTNNNTVWLPGWKRTKQQEKMAAAIVKSQITSSHSSPQSVIRYISLYLNGRDFNLRGHTLLKSKVSKDHNILYPSFHHRFHHRSPHPRTTTSMTIDKTRYFSCKSSDVEQAERVVEFQKSLRIVDVKGGPDEGLDRLGQKLVVQGWVQTLGVQNTVTFLEVNDGSCLSNIKCVINSDAEGYEQVESGLITTGSSVCVEGVVVVSQGSKQKVELNVAVVITAGGRSDAFSPIQKKRVTREFRPQTNTLDVDEVAVAAARRYGMHRKEGKVMVVEVGDSELKYWLVSSEGGSLDVKSFSRLRYEIKQGRDNLIDFIIKKCEEEAGLTLISNELTHVSVEAIECLLSGRRTQVRVLADLPNDKIQLELLIFKQTPKELNLDPAEFPEIEESIPTDSREVVVWILNVFARYFIGMEFHPHLKVTWTTPLSRVTFMGVKIVKIYLHELDLVNASYCLLTQVDCFTRHWLLESGYEKNDIDELLVVGNNKNLKLVSSIVERVMMKSPREIEFGVFYNRINPKGSLLVVETSGENTKICGYLELMNTKMLWISRCLVNAWNILPYTYNNVFSILFMKLLLSLSLVNLIQYPFQNLKYLGFSCFEEI